MQDANSDVHAHLARGDLEAASIAEAERALLRFVTSVTQHAYRVTDEDVEALRRHGWSDAQVAECVYDAALFAFFNRVADAFGLEDPHYFDHPPPRGGDPIGPGGSP